MPSSPKHVKRRDKDFYETPWECTNALIIEHNFAYPSRSFKMVEPAAGNGAISEIIKDIYPKCELIQYEIMKKTKKELSKYGKITITDFLKIKKVDLGVNYVLTNPPFSLAQEFIEHSLFLYPKAEIIMLLPLSLLGSIKRYKFWNDAPLTGIYILSKRPSFTNDGKTDSSVYGWFIFNGKYKNHYPIRFLKNF